MDYPYRPEFAAVGCFMVGPVSEHLGGLYVGEVVAWLDFFGSGDDE